MDKHTWDIIRIALKEAIPLPAIKAFFNILEYEEDSAFQDEVIKRLETISENADFIKVNVKNTEEIRAQLKLLSHIPIDRSLKRKLDEIGQNFPPLQTPHILYVLSDYNSVEDFYTIWEKSLNNYMKNDLENYIINRSNDYNHPINLIEHPVTKMAQYHALISGYSILNEMDILLGAFLNNSKTIQKLEAKFFQGKSHDLIIAKLEEYCEKSHTIVFTDEFMF